MTNRDSDGPARVMAARIYRTSAAALATALSTLLRAPIFGYRLFVSPLMPRACRFAPSCSEYALDAIRAHGPIRGTGLAAWRILRCNPWGGSGFDPVPPKLNFTHRASPGAHPTGDADATGETGCICG